MTVERLFLTDMEIGQRLGLKKESVPERLAVLERSGFPPPDPLFDNKRYWPAVKEFLDRRFGLAPDRPGATSPLRPDGRENW
ncbi:MULTISPECIES: winged helix-turn-helix domain-containing protein [Aurantimonas]|uniref:winged helix-turn-helix domain-containing protein n=1 Tax=Aurantimonas TaxID=182269 RepID=UPI0035143567